MVVDFHSHILPAIDDGSESLKESVAMLEMEAKQGIRHVIATPHFYAQNDRPDHFLAKRAEAETALREQIADRNDLPQLDVGAEVLYFRGISNSEILQELVMAGSKYVMIEMHAPPWTERMYQELEEIYIKQGLIPIIAHVDRYIGPLKTHGIPKRLQELPVLVQANASFFLRTSTRRMALRMLEKDQIHLLGSDCHNLSSRAPNLGAAVQVIERHLGKQAIHRINLYEREVLSD